MLKWKRVKTEVFLVFIFFVLFSPKLKAETAKPSSYGETLCRAEGFHCLKLGENVAGEKFSDTWASLWPDPNEREIVMKVNRLNIQLYKGLIIAVPNDMANKTFMDYSPFELQIDPLSLQPIIICTENFPTLDELLFEAQIKKRGEKLLVFDPQLLAWAAYDEAGNLVRWGPAVGGKDYCPDTRQICRTPEGEFKVALKASKNYRSHKFPAGCKDKDCAPMPYAMIFYTDGCAFHGSPEVPGRHASHGCVRLFIEDTEWLNKNFAEVGTKIIIKPYLKK